MNGRDVLRQQLRHRHDAAERTDELWSGLRPEEQAALESLAEFWRRPVPSFGAERHEWECTLDDLEWRAEQAVDALWLRADKAPPKRAVACCIDCGEDYVANSHSGGLCPTCSAVWGVEEAEALR